MATTPEIVLVRSTSLSQPPPGPGCRGLPGCSGKCLRNTMLPTGISGVSRNHGNSLGSTPESVRAGEDSRGNNPNRANTPNQSSILWCFIEVLLQDSQEIGRSVFKRFRPSAQILGSVLNLIPFLEKGDACTPFYCHCEHIRL